MQIAIDYSYFQSIIDSMMSIDPSRHPLLVSWDVLRNGGWAVLPPLFIYGLFLLRLYKKQNEYAAASDPVLLAIDVPKDNEQSMKAVEQIFAQLHGVKKSGSKWEKLYHGHFQLPFSMEIVSIDGYIQFLIRCPKKFRDVAEAAVYAQYPDAIITEVEDYAAKVNLKFPNKEYELFGTEFVFSKPNAYPVRTYIEFEHSLTQKLIDPMSAILETMSTLRMGEQIWIQLVITPIDDSWAEKGEKIVRKIAKIKEEKKASALDTAIEKPLNILWEVGQSVIDTPVEAKKEAKDDKSPSIMLHLTSGQKNVIEGIENKISKIAFKTKFRFIYLAKKELFNKARRSSIFGAIKQFDSMQLNSWKSSKKVKSTVDYFKKWREAPRKNKVLRAFKGRSQDRGAGTGVILNIEELASIYHFPTIEVKAPLIRKADQKRSEPPMSLPTAESLMQRAALAPIVAKQEKEPEPVDSVPQARPPDNLPVG